MTVDYQLEPADLRAIAQAQRRALPATWSRIYYFGILPVLAGGLAVVTQSIVIAAGFTALYLGAGWFVQARAQQLAERTAYSGDNLAFSTQRWHVVLADDGLRTTSETVEVFYRWTGIRKVFRSPQYVHILLTPLRQIYIPMRAFMDAEHTQKFISAAQAQVKNESN